MEDLRQQLQTLIDASPRNVHIMRDGAYCRQPNFLVQFAVEELMRILRIYEEHPQFVRPILLREESEASLRTYFWTKDEYRLRIAVTIGSLAAYHVSLEAENPLRGIILNSFARCVLVDWQRTRSDDNLLDDSIYYCRKAVELGPIQGTNRALHIYDLADQLSERYARQHDAGDYAEAEASFQQAFNLQPAGQLVFLFGWARLIRFKDEFENVDKAETLRRYINKLKVAIINHRPGIRPIDYRISVSCIWWYFGSALWERYEVTQDDLDLEYARKVFGLAMAVPRLTLSDMFYACRDQGRVAALQFEKNGNVEDANMATDSLRRALQLMPNSLLTMESLGNHLRIFAEYTDSDAMLAEAAKVLDKACHATTEPSNVLCNAYCMALLRLFQRTNRVEVLNDAILRYRTLADRPHQLEEDHAGTLLKLSQCHLCRFITLGWKYDLTKAQSAVARVYFFKTISAPLRAECLSVVGKIFYEYYKKTGRSQHLDHAIGWYRKALAKNVDHKDKNYAIHYDLGSAYHWKFRTTLLVADLSKAIYQYQLTLQYLKENSNPYLTSFFQISMAGLGMALMEQFEITKQQEDIDNAILCYEHCLRQTRKNTLQYIYRADILALAYQQRFKLIMEMADIKQSQTILHELLSCDLNLAPANMCEMHSNLGRAFLLSYAKNEEPTDLENAAEHFRSSLASECKAAACRMVVLFHLSLVLRYKAKATKSHEDEEAALAQIRATLYYLESVPENNLIVLTDGIILSFAKLIFDCWQDSGCESASDYGKIYVRVSQTIPRNLRAFSGFTLVSFYIHAAMAQFTVTKDPTAARDMIRTAADILPRAMLVSFDRKDIVKNLGDFIALPRFIIAFSLAAGDMPSHALQLFDKVRSVMWDCALSKRLISQEKAGENFPTLCAKLDRIQKPLGASESLDTTALPPGSLCEMIMHVHKVYLQIVESKQLFHELRSNSELEEFLRLPDDTPNLIEYAQDGPIIMVNESIFRSDAIIVTANGVEPLSLPLLDPQMMGEMEQWYDEALSLMSTDLPAATRKLEQVLEWLWDTIAEPILHHLGFDGVLTTGDDLPRSWWITAGRIGQFPLHAAGSPKKGPLCNLLDRTVPSYINSLRALGYTRSRLHPTQQDNDQPPDAKRGLLISMERTPGMNEHSDLLNSVHEVTSVQEILNSHGEASDLLKSPERDAVLDCLKRVKYAHFACHGICTEVDPARSALRLTDWFSSPLDVRSLLQQGDLPCQLVYLSSCQGAPNKSKFRDEGLHLAVGLQMAGVPHVVASLWRVDDVFRSEMAVRFYRALGKIGGHFNPSNSARALRKAIVDLRASGSSALFWAAYIHTGP